MKVKQFQVRVIPRNGNMYHVYVGGYTSSGAYSTACQMYPDATVIVEREV